MKRILVTGGAGFIGSHLIDSLLKDENWEVVCVDNFDPFYDLREKKKNCERHLNSSRYSFIELDIRSKDILDKKLSGNFDCVVHLAAKAGIRPSLERPLEYTEVNVSGTHNLLEWAKEKKVRQFIFGSSSSVYGVNPKVPWSEDDQVLKPISPYGATKVTGEILGSVYSHLYDIRFIALRFFTVYGPRQRPDLAIRKFASAILKGTPISVFGDGTTRRDYTYVNDIVNGIRGAIEQTDLKYEIINLGNNKPTALKNLISVLEESLEKKARVEFLPEQPGDVPQTYANIEKASRLLKYSPRTNLEAGIKNFTDWLKNSGDAC